VPVQPTLKHKFQEFLAPGIKQKATSAGIFFSLWNWRCPEGFGDKKKKKKKKKTINPLDAQKLQL
jgi:hypothetical protein